MRSRFIAGTVEDVINSIDTFVGQDSADGMVITFPNNMILGRRASSHETSIFNLDASFCVREPACFLARPGASPDTEPRQVRTRLASDTEIRIFIAAFRRGLFNSIIPAHLRLCPGARVMLLQNIDPTQVSLTDLSTSRFIVASVIESHAAQTCCSSVAPSIRCLSLLRMAHNISIGLRSGVLGAIQGGCRCDGATSPSSRGTCDWLRHPASATS